MKNSVLKTTKNPRQTLTGRIQNKTLYLLFCKVRARYRMSFGSLPFRMRSSANACPCMDERIWCDRARRPSQALVLFRQHLHNRIPSPNERITLLSCDHCLPLWHNEALLWSNIESIVCVSESICPNLRHKMPHLF